MTAAPSSDALRAAQTSDAIRLSRLICVFGMIYVHAWTGLEWVALANAAGTGQGMLRWSLMEVFGRSAVPLLGMISGWLVAGSVERKPYGAFLLGKARTLLAPMVLWNAIAIVLVSGAAFAGLIAAPMPTTWWWTLDELFCLASPNDINVQTPFLRDLLLCMVAAPLLVRLPRWGLELVGLGALAWTVSGVFWPLVLRPSIVMFFVIGMLARRQNWAVAAGKTPWALACAPFVALACLRFWLEITGREQALSTAASTGLDVLVRLAAAGFFWSIAWRLARSRASAVLLRLEPYAFLMFCDHLILMWLGGPFVGLLTGPLGAPLYPLFLLAQPVLVLLISIGISKVLTRFAPISGEILCGGRLGVSAPPALARFNAAEPCRA